MENMNNDAENVESCEDGSGIASVKETADVEMNQVEENLVKTEEEKTVVHFVDGVEIDYGDQDDAESKEEQNEDEQKLDAADENVANQNQEANDNQMEHSNGASGVLVIDDNEQANSMVLELVETVAEAVDDENLQDVKSENSKSSTKSENDRKKSKKADFVCRFENIAAGSKASKLKAFVCKEVKCDTTKLVRSHLKTDKEEEVLCGIVHFYTKEDALKAIEKFNDAEFNGNKLQVTLRTITIDTPKEEKHQSRSQTRKRISPPPRVKSPKQQERPRKASFDTKPKHYSRDRERDFRAAPPRQIFTSDLRRRGRSSPREHRMRSREAHHHHHRSDLNMRKDWHRPRSPPAPRERVHRAYVESRSAYVKPPSPRRSDFDRRVAEAETRRALAEAEAMEKAIRREEEEANMLRVQQKVVQKLRANKERLDLARREKEQQALALQKMREELATDAMSEAKQMYVNSRSGRSGLDSLKRRASPMGLPVAKSYRDSARGDMRGQAGEARAPYARDAAIRSAARSPAAAGRAAYGSKMPASSGAAMYSSRYGEQAAVAAGARSSDYSRPNVVPSSNAIQSSSYPSSKYSSFAHSSSSSASSNHMASRGMPSSAASSAYHSSSSVAGGSGGYSSSMYSRNMVSSSNSGRGGASFGASDAMHGQEQRRMGMSFSGTAAAAAATRDNGYRQGTSSGVAPARAFVGGSGSSRMPDAPAARYNNERSNVNEYARHMSGGQGGPPAAGMPSRYADRSRFYRG